MTAVRFSDLTSRRAGELAAGGDAVALIALAAVEQHGPHLPLATDAIIAERLADMTAARVEGDVLVAPVLPGGLSTHHLGFPGTVDLPVEVVRGYTEAYLTAFRELGVRGVGLFSSHGGNFGLLAEIAAAHADDALRVVAYADMGRYVEVMRAGAARVGLTVPDTDIHAGGLETSQILHILGENGVALPPEAVQGYTAAEPGWLERVQRDGVKGVSASGVLGRPAGARADAGAAICEALADELAAWLVRELAPAPMTL